VYAREMHVGRYVLAVVIGLAIGVAGGWLTHRPADSPPPHRQAAKHRAGPQRVQATPDQAAPTTPPEEAQPPSAERVQRMLDRCLSKPTALGQLTCLERVLELEWRSNPQAPRYDDPFSAPLDNSSYA
jgi:hypothetical protein